jgi:hypothetical protein
VWIFLLPLFFGIVSYGLVEGVYMKFKKFTPAFAMIVISLGAIQVVRGEAVLRSTDSGVLPHADEISRYLKPVLKNGDLFRVHSPHIEVLEYYFVKNEIDLKYLHEKHPVGEIYELLEASPGQPGKLLKDFGKLSLVSTQSSTYR